MVVTIDVVVLPLKPLTTSLHSNSTIRKWSWKDARSMVMVVVVLIPIVETALAEACGLP